MRKRSTPMGRGRRKWFSVPWRQNMREANALEQFLEELSKEEKRTIEVTRLTTNRLRVHPVTLLLCRGLNVTAKASTCIFNLHFRRPFISRP